MGVEAAGSEGAIASEFLLARLHVLSASDQQITSLPLP